MLGAWTASSNWEWPSDAYQTISRRTKNYHRSAMIRSFICYQRLLWFHHEIQIESMICTHPRWKWFHSNQHWLVSNCMDHRSCDTKNLATISPARRQTDFLYSRQLFVCSYFHNGIIVFLHALQNLDEDIENKMATKNGVGSTRKVWWSKMTTVDWHP